jgi:hypothetical protein
MKSGKYFLVLLLSIVLTAAIACGSGEAEPTPTPEIPIPTPTAIPVLPNLTITNITFNPTTGCEGAPVQVAVTIQNQGTLVSPACYWSWQLFAGSVTLLNTLPSLPPGGTTIVHTEMTLADDITGTFNTTAIVDPTSVVAELNESDNQLMQSLTVSICNFQSNYNSDKSNIQTALNAYMASHNGSIPVTNNSVTLSDPAGTYPIIDICALLGAGDLLDVVPSSCIDTSFDNCEATGCTCNQNAHYKWLVKGAGTVVSSCIGDDCEANSTDGYQSIWP